jgi:hypothetical protein
MTHPKLNLQELEESPPLKEEIAHLLRKETLVTVLITQKST